MSQTAPAVTSKWLAPIKPEFIASARRAAQSMDWDLDRLACELFGRAVDQLTVEEGFKLHGRIDNEIAERKQSPKADGPHDVRCVSCGKPYRCICDRLHEQGECHYCHNNTTEQAENYRRFHFGD